MALLWDRPENDEGFEKAEWLRENTDDESIVGRDYRALCTIYYEIANNGGCNLNATFFQDRIERLESVAVTYGLDCPSIFEQDEDDPEWATVIDLPIFDAFARDVIENLWTTLNPEINLD